MPKTAPTLAERLANLEERLNQLEGNTGRVDPANTDYDHGGLLGLGDDDHPHYVLEDAGTMLADPTVALGVATKQYVDRLSLLLPMLLVPDLRGLWLAGNTEATLWYDHTGQGRTLAITGAVVSGVLASGTPYVEFDGANDFAARADEAGLDVLTGFSIMAWLAPDDFDVDSGVVSKWSASANARSYLLRITNTTGVPMLRITSDGAAGTIVDISAGSACSAATWHCIQAYYTPSTNIAIRVDANAWAYNTTSIPAAIFNGLRALQIGQNDENAAKRLDGKMASVWLSGSPLAEATFEVIRAAQAPLFA